MSTPQPSVGEREGNAHTARAGEARASRHSRETWLGAWAAVSAAVLFGSAFVATAFQLRSFTPTSAAMWRGGVGAVLLATVVVLQRVRSRTPSPPTPAEPGRRWARRCRLMVLGALSGPIFVVGMNLAVAGAGSTITGFVVALYSVFSAAFAPLLLSEPLRGRAVAGLVCALLGTSLLAQFSLADASVSGMTAGLGAAVSYAFYLVLGRRWLAPFGIRPDQTALSAAVLTTLVGLAWLAMVEPGELVPDHWRADAVVALVWLGVVMVAGQTLVMASVRRVRAETSASLLLLNPLTAAVLGVALLGESLTTSQALGALLVLTGMASASGLFTVVRRRRRAVHPRAGRSAPRRRQMRRL